MKQKLNLLLLVSLVSIMIISCNKENKHQTNSFNRNNLQTMSTVVNGFDFDQFGISHNNYLIYVRSDSDFLNMTDEDAINYGNTYTDAYFGTLDSVIYSDIVIKYNSIVAPLVNDMLYATDPSEKWVKKGIFTPHFAIFWNKLSDEFKKALSDSLEPNSFFSNIEMLENWVVNNQTIQYDTINGVSNEGAAMIEMCSIAKYSYDYWYNNEDNWPPNGGSMTTMGIFKKIIRAVKIAASDASGYCSDIHACDGHNPLNGICWDHGQAMDDARAMSNYTAHNN